MHFSFEADFTPPIVQAPVIIIQLSHTRFVGFGRLQGAPSPYRSGPVGAYRNILSHAGIAPACIANFFMVGLSI